nr:hypothetical protein [Rickettsia conorii]
MFDSSIWRLSDSYSSRSTNIKSNTRFKLREIQEKKINASKDKIELNIKLVSNELKPSAKRLLDGIALLNNQSVSKELLNSITEDKHSLDDDIYQFSKFALISNIEPNEVNPIFEMHDGKNITKYYK